MARRMIGPSETIDFVAAGNLQLSYGRAGACSRPCTIGYFPRPGRGCGLALCHAQDSQRCRCRWRAPVHVNIERQARRRPVIGQDRDKIGLQKGCFPTARLAQSASREILLVRCCVPATVLRAKRRCSARRALLRLELRLPRTLSFETPPHQPRFARLACAAAFKIGAQAGSPLTVANTMAALQWGWLL